MVRILLLPILLWHSLAPAAFSKPQTEPPHGLRLIVVSTETEAVRLRNQILAGDSFEAMAREHSADVSASSGGYLGRFAPGDLRREFQAAVNGLKPGDLSRVIKVGNEFALLQLLSEVEESWMVRNDDGLRALEQKQYASAVQSFSEAVRTAEKFGPDDDRLLQSLIGLADSYRLSDRPMEAAPVYGRILAIRWAGPLGPEKSGIVEVLDSFAALLRLAYFRDTEFEEALEKYEQTVSRASLSESLYLAMNNILSGAELRAEAEKLMERAVAVFPESRNVRYRLAELHRDSGRMRRALQVFKEASVLKAPTGMNAALDRRQRSFIYQRIGGIHTDLVQFDDALSAHKTALGIDAANAEARLALADLYLRRDRLDEAAQEYARVVSEHPESAAAHSRLAELNFRMARFQEAAGEAAKALEIDPAHRRSSYVRAMSLIRLGQTEEGRKQLVEYQKLENNAQAQADEIRRVITVNRGGAALFLAGQTEEASETFRKGIESHPKTLAIYVNLGVAQSKLGRHREAIKTFEAALDLGHDGNFIVHLSLARAYEALGDAKAGQRRRVLYLRSIDAALEAGLN